MKYSLSRFIKNIKFLMKYNLNDKEETLKFEILSSVEDIYLYRILDSKRILNNRLLKVLNHEKTLDLLIAKPKSFCRFGDGELELCMGNGIPFQQYDSDLQKTLLEILQNDNDHMYVGVDYNYFSCLNELTETVKKFQINNAKKYRNFLMKQCYKERTYIATGFTQLYLMYNNYDYDNYYTKVKNLFKDKELVIFAGTGILSNLKYDVFELARSKEYINAPKNNAYNDIKILLKAAYNYPPDKKTFVFILGPTSNVLVYNLAQKGYMAWDIGHLAKDYDAYMRGIEKNEKNIVDFFKPD